MARIRTTGRPMSDSEAESAGENRNISSDEDLVDTSPTHMDVEAEGASKESEDDQLVEDDWGVEDEEAELEDIDDEDGNDIICPKKPSHLVFGNSSIKESDFKYYKEMNFIKDVSHCRCPGDEDTPTPASNEVVLFERFFTAGL